MAEWYGGMYLLQNGTGTLIDTVVALFMSQSFTTFTIAILSYKSLKISRSSHSEIKEHQFCT